MVIRGNSVILSSNELYFALGHRFVGTYTAKPCNPVIWSDEIELRIKNDKTTKTFNRPKS